MRTNRKKMIQLTVMFAFLAAGLETVLFVCFITNAFACQQIFMNAVAPAITLWSMTAKNILNVTMVTLASGSLINLLVAWIFLKFEKLSYVHIMQAKHSIIFLMISQFLLGLLPISSVLMMMVLFYPADKSETLQMTRFMVQKQMIEQFEQMGKNPQLFAMSLQIGFLKRELKLNQITEDTYFERLNEILVRGVAQDFSGFKTNKLS